MSMESSIVLGRGVKQDIIDLYRRYRNSTLHMNYANNTVTVTTCGRDEGVLIFGEMGEVICKIANGRESCSFQVVFDEIKAK